MKNELRKAVNAAGVKAQYDACVKRLLGQKEILAHILVRCVDEFKGMSPKEAVAYIEGEPYIGNVPSEPGLTNAVVCHGGSRIVGINTESTEVNEGLARFDIIFYVHAPANRAELAKIIVNIEAQKDEPTRYAVLNRAVYYVSRLVSSQKERDFTDSDYDNIRQVYSVWICMNMKENSMNHIHLTSDRLIGSHDWKGRLDLLNIIMIGIGSKASEYDDGHELHHLLGTLLSRKLTTDEKMEILETRYDIPIDDDMRREVGEMCNLSEGIEERAIEKGIAKGIAEGEASIIINMHNNGLSAEQIASLTDKNIEEVRKIIEKPRG